MAQTKQFLGTHLELVSPPWNQPLQFNLGVFSWAQLKEKTQGLVYTFVSVYTARIV